MIAHTLSSMWVPLHVHSQYSVLDAAASVEAIVERAAEFKMPAVALTDHGNLFGAVEFYKACKDAKIKAIIGCEVYMAPGSRFEKKRERNERTSFHLTLLAKNAIGYRNLCKLSSAGYLEGFYYHPRIDQELLKVHAEGLICLSGCLSGHLSQEILEGRPDTLDQTIDWYHQLFGEDYYLELQRHAMSEVDLERDGMEQESWLLQQYHDYIEKQKRVEAALLAASQRKGIPLVATNDSHYIDREDWRAHEVLLNIQSGEPCEICESDSQGNVTFRQPNPKRRTYATHECYFKSPEQMQQLFSDLPEAIKNSLAIAEKCCFDFDLKAKHYPVFVPPVLEGIKCDEKERQKAVEQFLFELCIKGIDQRYTPERLAKVKEVYPDRDPLEVVHERLKEEMSVIGPKGLCDYLLIVWDFIHWAKCRSIPVGPGRGSGVGSIVLYLIGVTDIEPLRFHLFFERFINPERPSYPDIDVDICMDRRQEVIDYTLQKYGKACVAQIITFGTMKAKMVIRDVGRVLNIPLSKVNAIAKLVPEDLNITLEKAVEKDQDLGRMCAVDEDAKRIFDLGKKLEGSIRNTGVHAAGIIISGQPLTDFIPICTAKDSSIPLTQYSMKPVESVGMLKIDFLGLKTLTAIDLCIKSIAESRGGSIDWMNLPLDDLLAFELLNQGKTLGIFQLESGGMQDLSRNLHLDKFEEIIAVTALYRPGPMAMIPSFIDRKHGREKIESDHSWMQEILAETYGIMVYQEQVMQIAQKLANYSLGEGDVLRRAMGKKDMVEMSRQREKFCQGAQKNGIDQEVASLIFDKMEQFAAYGFNKSHAAAYAYLTYVTSFLKAHYPQEWMAALMTCDSADLTKISKFIRECRMMQIEMLPPDINEAGLHFAATPKGIRFAMSGIKGVGTSVVEAIVNERRRAGPFSSFYQFFERTDAKKVGKKAAENLVDAGCFDFIGWTRPALKLSIEPMYEAAVKKKREQEAGIMTFFDLLKESNEARFHTPPPAKTPPVRDLLLKEKELLGFFLTGHPMDEYREILERLGCIPLRKIETLDHNQIFRTAFIVESVAVRFSTKNQKKFAILTISDGMISYELPIWADLFEQKQYLLRENQLLCAVLQLEKQEAERLSCRWLDDLTQANEAMLEASDKAYDYAKFMSNRRQQFINKPKKEKNMISQPKKCILHLNANEIRLTHILQLKQLFAENPGEKELTIEFRTGHNSLASLHSKSGIMLTQELRDTLMKLAVVMQIEEK